MFLYIMLFLILFMILIYLINLSKFNPMTMMLLLIFYSILLSLMMNFLNFSFWYSYIFFLIMVGGILILFIYLISVTSNEMLMNYFKFFNNLSFNFLINLNIMIFFIIMNYYFLKIFNFKIDLMKLLMINNFEFNNYKMLFMNIFIDLNMFLMFYLLLMMIMVVLICLKKSLPLRQMN